MLPSIGRATEPVAAVRGATRRDATPREQEQERTGRDGEDTSPRSKRAKADND